MTAAGSWMKSKTAGSRNLTRSVLFSIFFLQMLSLVSAQSGSVNYSCSSDPVMWERVNVREQDLYLGPGGDEYLPDLSQIKYIKEEKGGHNKKYRIKDGSGRVWVAKLGNEAQPETVSVRLLWALGFKTEINYLVPAINIPGKGVFENVRLEARPENTRRLGEWKWKNNPFVGTNEFQAMKLMMVFLNNWDIVNVQNEVLMQEGRSGCELHYVISDLGATFGRFGNNNFPFIYRYARSINNPKHYLESEFVVGIKVNLLKLSYKGKNRDLFKSITVEQGRWLADLLIQLSDRQIEDAFSAANYRDEEKRLFVQAVKNKIRELDEAVNNAP